jgi:hypothetical protein
MIKAAVPKWLSRKLLVFVIGCILLVLKLISEQTWLILAGMYIGSNFLDKVIDVVRGGK